MEAREVPSWRQHHRDLSLDSNIGSPTNADVMSPGAAKRRHQRQKSESAYHEMMQEFKQKSDLAMQIASRRPLGPGINDETPGLAINAVVADDRFAEHFEKPGKGRLPFSPRDNIRPSQAPVPITNYVKRRASLIEPPPKTGPYSPGRGNIQPQHVCSVSGCGLKVFAKGLCPVHLLGNSPKTPTGKTRKRFKMWSVTRQQRDTTTNEQLIAWNFIFHGNVHVVKLIHSPARNRVMLIVNDEVLLDSPLALNPNGGSERLSFALATGPMANAPTVPCAVSILSKGGRFRYELELEGKRFHEARGDFLQEMALADKKIRQLKKATSGSASFDFKQSKPRDRGMSPFQTAVFSPHSTSASMALPTSPQPTSPAPRSGYASPTPADSLSPQVGSPHFLASESPMRVAPSPMQVNRLAGLALSPHSPSSPTARRVMTANAGGLSGLAVPQVPLPMGFSSRSATPVDQGFVIGLPSAAQYQQLRTQGASSAGPSSGHASVSGRQLAGTKLAFGQPSSDVTRSPLMGLASPSRMLFPEKEKEQPTSQLASQSTSRAPFAPPLIINNDLGPQGSPEELNIFSPKAVQPAKAPILISDPKEYVRQNWKREDLRTLAAQGLSKKRVRWCFTVHGRKNEIKLSHRSDGKRTIKVNGRVWVTKQEDGPLAAEKGGRYFIDLEPYHVPCAVIFERAEFWDTDECGQPPSSDEDKFLYQLLIDFVPFEQCYMLTDYEDDTPRSPEHHKPSPSPASPKAVSQDSLGGLGSPSRR